MFYQYKNHYLNFTFVASISSELDVNINPDNADPDNPRLVTMIALAGVANPLMTLSDDNDLERKKLDDLVDAFEDFCNSEEG